MSENVRCWTARVCVSVVALVTLACGETTGARAPEAIDVASDAPVSHDVSPTLDAADPVDAPETRAPDADAILADDAPGPACDDGEWRCSDDAHTLTRCEDGVWREVVCIQDAGKLCEDGACVVPQSSTPPGIREAIQAHLRRHLHRIGAQCSTTTPPPDSL